MKLIKNIRKKQFEKYKARLNFKYKKILNKEIDKIREDYKAEVNKLIKRYEEKILQIDIEYEQELKIIREQERRRYDSIINEREAEILRLQRYIRDKKDLLNSIKEREYQFSEISKRVYEKFQRGLDKVVEGIQVINFAQNDIENYHRKQIKKDLKTKNIIKE